MDLDVDEDDQEAPPFKDKKQTSPSKKSVDGKKVDKAEAREKAKAQRE